MPSVLRHNGIFGLHIGRWSMVCKEQSKLSALGSRRCFSTVLSGRRADQVYGNFSVHGTNSVHGTSS